MVADSIHVDRDASLTDEMGGSAEAMAGMPMGRTLVLMPPRRVEVSSMDSAAKEAIHDSGVLLGRPYGLAQGPAPSPYSRQDWVVEADGVDVDEDMMAAGTMEGDAKKGVTEGREMVKTSPEMGMMEVDCIMEVLVSLKLTLLAMVVAELEGYTLIFVCLKWMERSWVTRVGCVLRFMKEVCVKGSEGKGRGVKMDCQIELTIELQRCQSRRHKCRRW